MATADAEAADADAAHAHRSSSGHVPEDAELDVPDGAELYRCPYCEYPLKTERLWVLHLGVQHPDEMDADQRERYEDEFDEETHDLFSLHVKLTVVILLLYFFITYTYVFVWS